MKELITNFAAPLRLEIRIAVEADRVSLDAYRFTRQGFHALVRYVWQGGYPRWRDGLRPDYVQKMKDAIGQCPSSFFSELCLQEGE